jgi:hypothetical protein
MAKTSISLVSVQKPTANTPILQRRNKLTSNIDQQIVKIGLFREGKRISREQFWVDGSGAIYFQLRYGKQPLELEKGKSTLKAATFDDLVAQLVVLAQLRTCWRTRLGQRNCFANYAVFDLLLDIYDD